MIGPDLSIPAGCRFRQRAATLSHAECVSGGSACSRPGTRTETVGR